MVTVYSVSSHSGSVNRTPTLRPDVSTTNGVAGVIVTCDSSTSARDCVVVTIRRDPDAAAAAAGSTDASVTRGPCATLAAAPATPSTASTATTMPNVPRNRRPRRRPDRVRRVAASVLIRVLGLRDLLDGGRVDHEAPVRRRAHGARDRHPLAGARRRGGADDGQTRGLGVDHAVRDDQAGQIEGAVAC